VLFQQHLNFGFNLAIKDMVLPHDIGKPFLRL
jgi:hypothetical protein